MNFTFINSLPKHQGFLVLNLGHQVENQGQNLEFSFGGGGLKTLTKGIKISLYAFLLLFTDKTKIGGGGFNPEA